MSNSSMSGLQGPSSNYMTRLLKACWEDTETKSTKQITVRSCCSDLLQKKSGSISCYSCSSIKIHTVAQHHQKSRCPPTKLMHSARPSKFALWFKMEQV